ncbi:hypothetical protein [Pseudanabaena yagii]|uniref:Uncharacterized protein n=1 Tax=Pseudanabaena yagii GIHE-NHR1 TaxID=2722753 RepID=A0ABX1M0L5_9CYAN|nr:hypothetical protein [Pseudanabaena yagii]NMF60750.1 hypothetical protein [Pseudanabaena yagii GIHE-NHR1]
MLSAENSDRTEDFLTRSTTVNIYTCSGGKYFPLEPRSPIYNQYPKYPIAIAVSIMSIAMI